MNTIIGSECTRESMFKTMGGWTSQFEVNGRMVGGSIPLTKDSRLLWHMKQVGGVRDKRILELGPLEGAHTKMMIEAGAKEVIAVEGLSDCFLRCLIVKEAFDLMNAKFIFGDFCYYVVNYKAEKFDIVSAAGVLYHQKNPAQLIHDLARITDNVFVWSQVASNGFPSDIETVISGNGISYSGKIKQWGRSRLTTETYCASLENEAVWMYPNEMIRCFNNAGFDHIIEEPRTSNINGDCILFVASKVNL